jgi:hypothetical protein
VALEGRGETVEDGGRLAAGITARVGLVFLYRGDAFDGLLTTPPLFLLFRSWFYAISGIRVMVLSSALIGDVQSQFALSTRLRQGASMARCVVRRRDWTADSKRLGEHH